MVNVSFCGDESGCRGLLVGVGEDTRDLSGRLGRSIRGLP